MPNKHLFANNVSTTVVSLSGTAGTSLVVASSAGVPVPAVGQDFRATLMRLSDGLLEIVNVTAVAGTTWTIVRAQEGTTALSFAAGDKVELRLTAGVMADLLQSDLLPKVTSLRMIDNFSSGTLIKFDGVYRDDGGYWNPATKNVAAPFDSFGTVTINLVVLAGSSGPFYKEFALIVAGVPRSQVNITLPSGIPVPILLSFTGPLSGQVAVEVQSIANLTILGANSGPTGTNFGMVVLPSPVA
jgi:hypothetical protein